MSLLPGAIMSLFGRSTTPVQQPAQADPATAAAQLAAANANKTVPNATTPASNGSVAAIPAVGTGDQSPLAGFKDLWQADPNNKAPANPSIVPNFNLDHKGLFDAASKVSFTNHISPELITKAMSGDAESFLEVINQANRYGYASATATSGEIIKNSLSSAEGLLSSQVLPAALRRQEISQALQASNPVFSDPAVSPMLGMLKDQLQSKYPTSSAEEIAGMATQYLAGMSEKIVTASGGSITAKSDTTASRGFGSPPPTDWEKYFAQ